MINLSKMKNICFLLFLFLGLSNIDAQRVIIYEDLREREQIPTYGPNRKHFLHSYYGMGFILGEPSGKGSNIRIPRSNNIEIGFRYKYKLSHHLSTGFDIAYLRNSFHLKQTDVKTFPDTELYDSQNLVLSNLLGGVYTRFNYGRRGNYIGRFVDIGINASWIYRNRMFSMLTEDSVETEMIVSGESHFNTFAYNSVLRVGFNNFVFKSTYRLNDIFRENSGFDELPRFYFGLEIGLHPL